MPVTGRRGFTGSSNGTLDEQAHQGEQGPSTSDGLLETLGQLTDQLNTVTQELKQQRSVQAEISGRLDQQQEQLGQLQQSSRALVPHTDSGALARANANLAKAEGLQQGLLYALERERDVREQYETHIRRLEDREDRQEARQEKREQFLLSTLEQLESHYDSMFTHHDRQLDRLESELREAHGTIRDLASRKRWVFGFGRMD